MDYSETAGLNVEVLGASVVRDMILLGGGGCNAIHSTVAGGFLLWLKEVERCSTSEVSDLGTIAPALGILYTLIISFASDLVLGLALAITAAHR